MKKIEFILAILLFAIILIYLTANTNKAVSNPIPAEMTALDSTARHVADTTDDEDIPEELRFYKEKYDTSYARPFQDVWNSIKKSLEDCGCMVEQESKTQESTGLFKGSIRSDMCVFTQGLDSTLEELKRFSLHLPIIPGAKWANGRLQYKFSIKESAENKTTLVLRTEMSGFEDYVTAQVHFWKSNGLLEMKMLALIKKNLNQSKN